MAVSDVKKFNPNSLIPTRFSPVVKRKPLVVSPTPGFPTPGFPTTQPITPSIGPHPVAFNMSSPSSSPYSGVARSMVGDSSPFPQPNSLPQNFNFNDLATYEENKLHDFSTNSQKQLADRRVALAKSLNDQGTELFNQNLPDINESLNSSGVFTSPTANATARADALKKIALSNNQTLNDFDTSATAYGLQTEQDALNSGLDLRRSQLEAELQQGQSAQDQALAEKLAKQQGRNSLTGSLIGAGGGLIGGVLGNARNLFGIGSKVAAVPGAAPSVAGALPAVVPGAGQLASAGIADTGAVAPAVATPAAGIGLGGAAAIGGAGIGAALLSRAADNAAGGGIKGKIAGTFANPIGAQLNAAKSAISKLTGGGKSHTDTQGSDAWRQGLSSDQVAVQFGQNGKGVSFDANNPGSAEANWNATINSFTPDQLVQRYSAGSGRTGTALDKQYQAYFDQLKQQLGRNPTADELVGMA